MARKKKKVPEINASSMADISFLLLIFFLVTTTMDQDNGLTRRLPQYDEDINDKDIKVKARNILNVMVNSHDLMMVNGKKRDITELKDITVDFLTPREGEEFPETEWKTIEVADKPFLTNKGIISLKADRGTSYDMYIAVQNELAKAYTIIRNDISQRFFNKPYNSLTDQEEIDAVNKAIPMRISEAEPEEIK